MYSVEYSKKALRNIKQAKKQHKTEFLYAVSEVIKEIKKDPFIDKYRNHGLRGNLKKWRSVTPLSSEKDRILFTVCSESKKIFIQSILGHYPKKHTANIPNIKDIC